MQILTTNNLNFEKPSRNPSNWTEVIMFGNKLFYQHAGINTELGRY